MNKYDHNTNPIVISKAYSVKQADDDGVAQFRQGVNFINEGHIDAGRKCMQEAARIFQTINDFYISNYDNDKPKIYYALISASQHTNKNNRLIELMERCNCLLDNAERNLSHVTDVLNGYDILPNIDPNISQATWLKTKAQCRFRKCIDRLEKGDIKSGIQLAEETKNLLAKVDIHELYTASNRKPIRTIEACLRLLKDPENLPTVIRVLKGETIHAPL